MTTTAPITAAHLAVAQLQAAVAQLRGEGASVIRLDHVESIIGPNRARAARRLALHQLDVRRARG